MNMASAREIFGRWVLMGSLVLTGLAIAELILMELCSIFHLFLYSYAHCIWIHTDDRSELRILIYTWLSSGVMCGLSCFAKGAPRKRAATVSSSMLLGMPATLYLLVCIDGWIRFGF